MRLSGWLLLLGLLTAPVARASACVPDKLSNYISLGAGGCAIGSLNVTDFSYNLIAGTVLIDASQILVTPTVTPDKLSLNFSSPDFSVSSPDFSQYLLSYTWDPGDIRSADDVLNDPVTSPGLGQITTDLCAGAAFSGAVCPGTAAQLKVFDNGNAAVLFDSTNFSPGVGTVGVRDTIDLDASQGGSVKIDSFTNEVVLPEPDVKFVTALLGLGLVIQRLRAKRR